MSYYELLGLTQEPFSTSPDPYFFYRSQAHQSALQRLEINIRLKRGLSLILGDIGTGKTTLCRALLQDLDEPTFLTHVILDPRYDSEYQFLYSLCRMFEVEPANRSTIDCQEAIQHHLIQKGVHDGKTTILIIDEGQNLTPSLIEIVRSLLNFETNQFKLLQVVIFGQLDFVRKIQRIRNFAERISMKYIVNPLSLEETGEMIRYRLSQAGNGGRDIFTSDAVENIYYQTEGIPRRINFLAHHALQHLVINKRPVVDGTIVQTVMQEQGVPWDAYSKAAAI